MQSMNSPSEITNSLSKVYTGQAIIAAFILSLPITIAFYSHIHSEDPSDRVSLNEFQIVFMVTTGIGLALNKIIELSWQLDAIDTDEECPIYLPLNIYFGALFCAALLVLLNIPVIAQIFGMIGMLISLLTLPYVFIATFFAALFCAYRAYIFANTQSKLRNTVEQAKTEDPLSGTSVISALGEEATSPAHARALRKDIDQLYEDAKSIVEARRAERDKLTAEAKEDIARLSKEAEISQLLRENEKLKEENKHLKRHRKAKKDQPNDP